MLPTERINLIIYVENEKSWILKTVYGKAFIKFF